MHTSLENEFRKLVQVGLTHNLDRDEAGEADGDDVRPEEGEVTAERADGDLTVDVLRSGEPRRDSTAETGNRTYVCSKVL